jgi:carbon-monoxide dehydrogenase medium subunit
VKWIDYTSPGSLNEALALLAEKGDKARILAGGTDLLVLLRTRPDRVKNPDLIVDVKSIPELNELSYSPGAGLTLGAAVPCYKIYGNPEVSKAYPGLIDSASLIGGIQIQGRASIGGNLCNATPSADSIPALIAHSVTCKIAGRNGTREVAVEDFCTGPSQTVLKPDEILVSMHFPPPPDNFGARYIRFIPRNEMDIAVAGAGVSVVLDNGTFKSARVSLASVAPTPLLVKEAGEALVGKPVNEESIKTAADIAKDAARPINDMRGTIDYRTHLCEVLTRRALNAAIERARGGTVDAH